MFIWKQIPHGVLPISSPRSRDLHLASKASSMRPIPTPKYQYLASTNKALGILLIIIT